MISALCNHLDGHDHECSGWVWSGVVEGAPNLESARPESRSWVPPSSPDAGKTSTSLGLSFLLCKIQILIAVGIK